MKWTLIIIGAIVFLILIILIIGKLLPVKHTAVVKKEFKIDKTTLWKTIRNFEKYAEWRTSIKNIETINSTSWTEVVTKGDKITFGITQEEPNMKLTAKILGDNLPFGGQWTFEISDSNKQIILQITENGEVYNPIYRFIGHFFMDNSATIKKYMADLENLFNRKE